MRSTFYFRSGYSFPKCAAARRAWIQIQLDLRNVQDLWCFQALLHSSPDGKSQPRLCHDQHQALPPAQPGPEDVTQQPFHQAQCFVLEPEQSLQKCTQPFVN